MKRPSDYQILFEIARQLNREYSLHAALQKVLQKTVDLLALQTGWIWLTEESSRSVYLAASYQLPPALSEHPERLSGWCYCLEKYFSNEIENASNISEIRCTRLKDISQGTLNLKFHASIPIFIDQQKVGLLNLLTKESQQLSEAQLDLLNVIGELIGVTIQRTHVQGSASKRSDAGQPFHSPILERILAYQSEQLEKLMQQASQAFANNTPKEAESLVQKGQQLLREFRAEVELILRESSEQNHTPQQQVFAYPSTPLSPREVEVLQLVKEGLINRQIADRLFISERTVKFHISSILSKLHTKTRTEAVNVAIQRGLMEI